MNAETETQLENFETREHEERPLETENVEFDKFLIYELY